MNGEKMKDKNDNKTKRSRNDSLNDTGKFAKFTLGKGYIPPNKQSNEAQITEKKAVQSELKYMPDGPNGTEGTPFYEIERPIKSTRPR